MLSILVAHSYFLRFDQKQLERAKPYPPLATLQVASSLREAGHQVAVFDAMLAGGVDEYDQQLRASQPQLALFYEDNFNFLSKMCLGKMRQAACDMIGNAHRSGARVIVAGSDASDAPASYLAAGAEVVLIGEGLSALRALLRRLNSDPTLSTTQWVADISGIVTITNGRLNVPKSKPNSLDQQQSSRPAWDLIDIERYRSTWRSVHGFFSLNMAASRGCSFRCHWCAKPIWGNHYLQRDPAEVAAEMSYLKRDFGPDHIWFADDIFGFRVDWVSKFAAALHADHGSVPFTIQTRADLVSTAMAGVLSEAGCREVWIGAESGSQRVLNAMNKGTTVEDISLARKRLAATNIRVGFFIQLGYLGEELEDILATRALIENTRPDDIGVSVSYPLPGTKFYELVRRQLQHKTHWQESKDLDMMFEGTYSSEFYRSIRDLLHDQVLLDNSNNQPHDADYQHARRSLQRRWDCLIADEQEYRNYRAEVRAPC
ncbi:MAG TPA: radical SAM protein [Steroidobacter sp.]|uniref:B12-binding domain-containing radical SAM protein n=1 Tax=Steroidobacter sp. TaxID=1978227 RepID=UPI002ED8AC1A